MANETQEIGDIVKKCKILLLDIEGTTTSISFVKDKLFPYAEENVQKFLEDEWEKDDVKEVVCALRKLALEDQENKVDGVVIIPGEDASKDEQIGGLVNSVKWQMSSDRKEGALKQLQGLIWEQGYNNGDIKGHVYDDVATALEQWRSTEDQKVFIYSSGSVQAQKLLFGQSLAGDLLARIDGHFDTAVGAKQDAASYTAIAEKIATKPEEILFLTDIVKEAEAARTAGLHAALVSREGNAPLPETATASFPVLHSLAQLTATNKRKPDPQVEEETPAKVPKTDAEKDVKATAEAVNAAATKEEKKVEEKMDVETENVAEKPTEPEKEEVKVVTVIEEITDSNEPVDAPMIDIEPVVEEEHKTKEKETEEIETGEKQTKKEVSITMNDDSDLKPIEKTNPNNDGDAPSVAETTSVESMVIEEITSDKSPLEDVADIVDDLVPVVEEPSPTEDMDMLQNVGEVLEKECDEILSKVQDVTNLDSITVKPLLNPIAEETMETENLDTNDIMDRILDTEQEQELEMKQKEIMDAAAISEEKKNKKENVVEEAPIKEANGIDGKTSEIKVESNKKDEDNNSTTEIKAEESSDMETQVENKPEMETPTTESKDTPVESDKIGEIENTLKENKDKEMNPVEEIKPDQESPVEEIKDESVEEDSTATEPKACEESKPDECKVNETSKPEEKSSESQINGKATNGDSAPDTNGDANKQEELCSRLAVENGKVAVNGSNGDSMDAEQGQGDSKIEEIAADIKVKTVAGVEPPADPIEKPTEA